MYAKKQEPVEYRTISHLHGATVTGRWGRDRHSPLKATQGCLCSNQSGTCQRPDESPWWQRESSETEGWPILQNHQYTWRAGVLGFVGMHCVTLTLTTE